MVRGIISILINDSGVQSAVGLNKLGTKYKVYPVVCPMPENVPYSIVRQISKIPQECKGQAPTTYTYTYEVLSFHKNYLDVERIDNAIVAALSLPEETISSNGVVFQEIRFVNTRDEYVTDYKGLYCKLSTFEGMTDERLTADSTYWTADSTLVTSDMN